MRKGFTLIELLVVVLIIGILASVALPQYFKSVENARISEVIEFTRAFMDAQDRHWMKYGRYAKNLTSLDIDEPAKKDSYFTFEKQPLTYFGIADVHSTYLKFVRRQQVLTYGYYRINMNFNSSKTPYHLESAYCLPGSGNNSFDPCTRVINQTFNSDLYQSMKRNNKW